MLICIFTYLLYDFVLLKLQSLLENHYLITRKQNQDHATIMLNICYGVLIVSSACRQILLASEIMVFLGILGSFHIVSPYTVPQYVCSGLIMFVAAEVLEGKTSPVPFFFLIKKRMCCRWNLSI